MGGVGGTRRKKKNNKKASALKPGSDKGVMVVDGSRPVLLSAVGLLSHYVLDGRSPGSH
jgi:hypothetical protein